MDKESKRIFEKLYNLYDRYEDPRHVICAEGAEYIRKLSESTPHWISVKDELPKNEKDVLISVKRKLTGLNGAPDKEFRRIVKAFYTDGKHSIDDSSCDWGECDADLFDYDEKRDTYLIPEGWWECADYGEQFYHVDDFVTHWMSLPISPKEEK